MTQSNSNQDRLMEAYYAEIRKCAPLTYEEEQALFKRYRTCTKCGRRFRPGEGHANCDRCGTRRDLAARERLVKGALRFVVKVAKEYARRTKGMRYEPDFLAMLVSAGNMGLLVAVDRFDTNKGTRFLTYAAWWIREKILVELDNMGVVRVPAYRQKQLRARRKIGDATDDMAQVQMEDLAAAEAAPAEEALEQDLMNTYGTTLIHQALQDLGVRARDKYIVLAYFGAKEDPKNLRQISARLTLSSERVRQIKKDTLQKLKEQLESLSITDSGDVFTE